MFFQILQLFLLCSGAECCDVYIQTANPLEALSGSCLRILCFYSPYRQYTYKEYPVTGFWFKHDYENNTAFSVSGNPNMSHPMNIIGDLDRRNCTTMFYDLNQSHEDRYFFGVNDTKDKLQTLYSCNSLQITVRDSPWSPTVGVSGDQTESGVVTVSCSAPTPCPHSPPALTWDPHQGTAPVTETLGYWTLITKVSQNLSLTDAHDGLVIKCVASYPVSGGFRSADSNVTLSVSYGPKDTSVEVSPSGPLSAGESVMLSCSSRAKPPVQNITWFRHSSRGAAQVSLGHTYSFNFTEQGQYYCVASNPLGNETSAVVTLSIAEPAPGRSDVIGPYIVVKLCGIILLCSALGLWECWFRATYAKKQEQRPEANVSSATAAPA